MRRKRRTPNIEHPMSNDTAPASNPGKLSELSVQRWTARSRKLSELSVGRLLQNLS
jgi:hypothetical protein